METDKKTAGDWRWQCKEEAAWEIMASPLGGRQQEAPASAFLFLPKGSIGFHLKAMDFSSVYRMRSNADCCAHCLRNYLQLCKRATLGCRRAQQPPLQHLSRQEGHGPLHPKYLCSNLCDMGITWGFHHCHHQNSRIWWLCSPKDTKGLPTQATQVPTLPEEQTSAWCYYVWSQNRNFLCSRGGKVRGIKGIYQSQSSSFVLQGDVTHLFEHLWEQQKCDQPIGYRKGGRWCRNKKRAHFTGESRTNSLPAKIRKRTVPIREELLVPLKKWRE